MFIWIRFIGSGFIVSLCFSLGWWMAVSVRVSNDEIRHFRHCFLSVAVQVWGSPSLTHIIPFQCLMCDQYGSPWMYYSIGPCWIGKTHDVHWFVQTTIPWQSQAIPLDQFPPTGGDWDGFSFKQTDLLFCGHVRADFRRQGVSKRCIFLVSNLSFVTCDNRFQMLCLPSGKLT